MKVVAFVNENSKTGGQAGSSLSLHSLSTLLLWDYFVLWVHCGGRDPLNVVKESA